jgi:hypothetical protein
VLLLDTHTLATYLPDDSFYYFQLASNFVSGKISSVDGIHLSNGYHPLWVWNIAPFFLFKSMDVFLPVKLSILYAGMLNIGSSILIFRFLNHWLGRKYLALLGMVAYLFNPRILMVELCGEPSALSNFLLVWILWRTYRVIDRGIFVTKDSLILGILGGLFMLARTDNLVFYGLLWILLLFSIKPLPWRQLLLMPAISLLILTPWMLWNIGNFGTIVQSSALACSYIQQMNVAAGIYTIAGGNKFALLQINANEGIFFYFIKDIISAPILSLSLAVFLFNDLRLKSTVRLLFLIWIGIFLLLFGHSYMLDYFRQWHTASAAPIVIITLILVLHLFTRPPFKRIMLVIASSILYAMFVIWLAVYFIKTPPFPWQQDVLNALPWVENQPSQSYAVYDGGLINYLTDGRVLPIDGNISNDAYSAVRMGQVYDYLKDNHVKYLIGWEWILKRYKLFWGYPVTECFKTAEGLDVSQFLNSGIFPSNPDYGRFSVWELIK